MKWLLALLIVTVSTPGLEKGLGGVMCIGAAHAIVMASAKQEAPAVPEDWVCARAGWIKGGRRTEDGPCKCHAVASKESSCEERVEDKACNR